MCRMASMKGESMKEFLDTFSWGKTGDREIVLKPFNIRHDIREYKSPPYNTVYSYYSTFKSVVSIPDDMPDKDRFLEEHARQVRESFREMLIGEYRKDLMEIQRMAVADGNYKLVEAVSDLYGKMFYD